jgi:YgiT-type zinc finger domain-containing protein
MLSTAFRGQFTERFVCPVCRLGHLDLRPAVYIRMYGETLIHVPNTPAWECDVCRQRQFDPASVQRIELLVGQAGPPPNRYRPQPTPATLRPAEPLTTTPKMNPGTQSLKKPAKPTKAVKPRPKPKG